MSGFKVSTGFSLIELLVVIAVIGVLAGAVIAIINPSAQLARARDAARKSDLHGLIQAFNEYNVINGRFPVLSGTHCIGVGSTDTCWGDRNMPGSDTLIQYLTPYLKAFPKDPLPNRGWGDRYMYMDGSTSNTGCDANSTYGHYIIWRPDKQPASLSDCQSFGYYSCCGTGGPCSSQGGYFCAYKLD
jgi:prepilin-type N-terminal cleavage/methylation domain-containing protein